MADEVECSSCDRVLKFDEDKFRWIHADDDTPLCDGAHELWPEPAERDMESVPGWDDRGWMDADGNINF